MQGAKEHFTIEVNEKGVRIQEYGGGEVVFSPSEALMLLDILREEENSLREAAEAACPLPIRVDVTGSGVRE